MAMSTPRRYDSTARQAEAQSRREAVTDVAARLFVKHGYAETTITQIAEAAGVSPQLVYAAFGGKAGLLSAVVDVLSAGDHEPGLIRDRPDSRALLDIDDMPERLRAAAAQMSELNSRVGPVL